MASDRVKQVVFYAIQSVVLTLAAAPFLVVYLTTWTEGGLRRSLAAELPPGSSRVQVVAWLDSHQIYHSPLCDRQGNSYSPLEAAIYNANVAWLENGRFEHLFLLRWHRQARPLVGRGRTYFALICGPHLGCRSVHV